jgi:hypothetical protein
VNVSAPVSAPDLAGLLLLLAAPAGAAASPGSAPTQSLPTGAETPPSFESALAELLGLGGDAAETKVSSDVKLEDTPDPALRGEVKPDLKSPSKPEFKLESRPQKKPDAKNDSEPESKVLITGVETPGPWPASPPPPVNLDVLVSVEPVKAEPLADDAAPTVAPPPLPFVPDAPARPPEMHKAAAAEPRSVHPDTAHISIPVLPVDADIIVPAQTRTPELPHPAFAERFTPAPAPAPQHAPAPPPLPELQRDRKVAEKPDPALAPSVPAAKSDKSEPATEHRQDNHTEDDRDSRERSAPAPAATAPRPDERIEQPRFEPPPPVSTATRPAQPVAPSSTSENKPAVIRTAEIEPTRQPPPVHAGDARTISLRLTDAGEQRVELKISDHAGEVKVAVRAADPDLAGSLRENLGDLVHRLEQSGLRADTWHPSATESAGGPKQTAHADNESFDGSQSGGRQQQSGDGRERRQQQQPERARWLEEFGSFAPDLERSTTPWPPA